MSEDSLLDKYNNWVHANEGKINTYANHLIVIFAFSVPTLVSVRRVSISLIILLFIARGRILHHTYNVLRDPLVLSFFLYFLVHFIWLVGADDLISAKKSLHDASFLLFTPLFASFIDRKYVNRIIGAFILGMFVSVMASYGLLFELISPMLHNGTHGTADDPTPLYHHTHYGYMLAVTSTFLLYGFFLVKENSFKKIALLILFVAVVLIMFLIKGRTGYIIFVMLLPAIILLHYRSRAIKPLIIAMTVIGITSILAYNYIDVFKNRVDLTVTSFKSLEADKNYNTSIGARAGMFMYSLDVILENVAFGNGTGDSVSEVRKLVKEENRELSRNVKALLHTHNEYINALLQFGIVGLLVFLNIPYQMFTYSKKKNGVMLKIIGISILLYSLIEVFIIGLGMLLTVVTLSSVLLANYNVTNTKHEPIDSMQIASYMFIVLSFYLIKIVLP